MNGTEGEQAAKTRQLAAAVAQEAGLPLHYVDERLTSAEADRALREGGLSRRKRKVRQDTLAALLIPSGVAGRPPGSRYPGTRSKRSGQSLDHDGERRCIGDKCPSSRAHMTLSFIRRRVRCGRQGGQWFFG